MSFYIKLGMIGIGLTSATAIFKPEIASFYSPTAVAAGLTDPFNSRKYGLGFALFHNDSGHNSISITEMYEAPTGTMELYKPITEFRDPFQLKDTFFSNPERGR